MEQSLYKTRKFLKATCNSQDQHRCSWSYSTDPNSYITSYFLLTADKYTPKPVWCSILLRSAPVAHCVFLVPWNGALLPSIQNEMEILFNILCFIPFGVASPRWVIFCHIFYKIRIIRCEHFKLNWCRLLKYCFRPSLAVIDLMRIIVGISHVYLFQTIVLFISLLSKIYTIHRFNIYIIFTR